MKIVEIFNSIEGEGKRAGFPCTFIRLYGCNLHCSYCDSRYACDNNGYIEMTLEEILNTVASYECKLVTVTGGEPYIHEDINSLLWELTHSGYEVNVETNGTQQVNNNLPNLFNTVDYKSLSSGMNKYMDITVFAKMYATDVLKCVVGNVEDLDDFLQFTKKVQTVAQIFVSPVFGKIEPKEIVEYIQEHKLYDWRVQVQLHKVIWDPDMRGV